MSFTVAGFLPGSCTRCTWSVPEPQLTVKCVFTLSTICPALALELSHGHSSFENAQTLIAQYRIGGVSSYTRANLTINLRRAQAPINKRLGLF